MTTPHHSDAARVGAAVAALLQGQPLPPPGAVELTELLASIQRLINDDTFAQWAVVGTVACGALVQRLRQGVQTPATTSRSPAQRKVRPPRVH
jgi:hypothetical protein